MVFSYSVVANLIIKKPARKNLYEEYISKVINKIRGLYYLLYE